MRIFHNIVLGACVAACPASAVDHWTIYDLGGSRKEQICLTASRQALEDFGRVFGLDRLESGNWAVFAYGLKKGAHDAVITCSPGPAGGSRATLVIYSDVSIAARMPARWILDHWTEVNEQLQNDWITERLRANGL